MSGLIGKKLGMTSIFDANGKQIPCTVLEVGPCVVTQVKTSETDGYSAVQIAYGDAKEKNTPAALNGIFKKQTLPLNQRWQSLKALSKHLVLVRL